MVRFLCAMGLFGPWLMRLIIADIYLSPSVTSPPDRGLIRIHIEHFPGVLVSVWTPSLIDLSSSILFLGKWCFLIMPIGMAKKKLDIFQDSLSFANDIISTDLKSCFIMTIGEKS